MRGKKTGGRKAGTRNKATADVKAMAQKHGAAALRSLVKIANGGPDIAPAAQVAACKEILDRAYGKSPQAIGGTDDLPEIRQGLKIQFVERVIVDAEDGKKVER